MNVSSFMLHLCQKVSEDLVTAYNRIPEDKKGWAPAETARSAKNQLAELALLNASSASVIEQGSWHAIDMKGYFAAKAELDSKDSAEVLAEFHKGTAKLLETLASYKGENLDTTIETAFGQMKMADLVGYPYWNMSYHLGQINYIASILGVLD